MVWFCIRTAPGAQLPRREYWAEPSLSAMKGRPRGRGYRIATSLNPAMSAIETALEAAGITHYMPAEFAVVRNRRRPGIYEMRRFALMKGYMFVLDPDWSALRDSPGVLGVVSNAGVPHPISPIDLFRLRMYEANSRAEAEARARSLSAAGERLAREKQKLIVRRARKKYFPGRRVKLIWGEKAGRAATVQAWDDQDQVRLILDGLEAAETIAVPLEYLKAG